MIQRCVGCDRDKACETRTLGTLRLTLCDACHWKATAEPEPEAHAEPELKPCPSCGGPLEVVGTLIPAAPYRAYCHRCLLYFAASETRREAIEIANRRAESDGMSRALWIVESELSAYRSAQQTDRDRCDSADGAHYGGMVDAALRITRRLRSAGATEPEPDLAPGLRRAEEIVIADAAECAEEAKRCASDAPDAPNTRSRAATIAHEARQLYCQAECERLIDAINAELAKIGGKGNA